MKHNQLLRKIGMETGLVLVLLVLLGGIVYYLGAVHDDYERQTNMLQNEVLVLQQETAELQDKFSRVQKNADLYQRAIDKQSQGKLAITRQMARDKFNKFNDEYFLGNLRLTMSAIDELAEAKYRRNSGTIMKSDVSVNFEAVSDEHIFNMMNAMQQQMAGSIQITKLSLQKQRTLSDDILRVISQKGSFPLVVGEIRFKWFGMKPIEIGNGNTIKPNN